jgi:hypothetical protein
MFFSFIDCHLEAQKATHFIQNGPNNDVGYGPSNHMNNAFGPPNHSQLLPESL